MSTKEQAIATIQSLPDSVTWAEISERVQILAAIEQAEAEIERGEGIPHEEAQRRINEGLQKLSGRQAV